MAKTKGKVETVISNDGQTRLKGNVRSQSTVLKTAKPPKTNINKVNIESTTTATKAQLAEFEALSAELEAQVAELKAQVAEFGDEVETKVKTKAKTKVEDKVEEDNTVITYGIVGWAIGAGMLGPN